MKKIDSVSYPQGAFYTLGMFEFFRGQWKLPGLRALDLQTEMLFMLCRRY